MKEYLSILRHILETGETSRNRTADLTISTFGGSFKYDFKGDEIPLLTSKKMMYPSVLSELLWFIEGSTNERRLAEIRYNDTRENLTEKRTIWTDNFENQGRALGYNDGELGPVYGHQWRHWTTVNGEIDQYQRLIDEIKTNPSSRRLLVSAWNVGDLDRMALPPCHLLFQCKVHFKENEPYGLSLQWYQRSVDAFLGLPYNIASYGTLLRILCHKTGLRPVSLLGSFGDLHIYESHVDAVKTQLTRKTHPLPILKIHGNAETMTDFELLGYVSEDSIKAKMIV